MAVLSAAGLRAGYRGRMVLHGVDLEYDKGLHVLLGPNGAGKTTLFRVLSGVLPPAHGQVLINGVDPHADPAAKVLVGLSGHRAALAARLSVADNLRYWARVLGLPAAERERRVRDVLGAVDLGDIAGQRAATLSRGQSQRAGVAKALLGNPPVVLLDEPTSGVDPGMAVRLRAQLKTLAQAGHTVVMSTHQLAEAQEIADDVTVLHEGRIVGRGAPGALRTQLVGTAYRVRLRCSGDLPGALRTLGYRPEPAAGGAVLVDVAGEQDVENLVTGLVRAGVGVREVSPADNILEEVYVHLQEQAGDHVRG
jgi:ABC-2 type transport system ATP-binding protein